MASKFRNAGQTCVCANRVLVHASVLREVRAPPAPRAPRADAPLNIGRTFSLHRRTNLGQDAVPVSVHALPSSTNASRPRRRQVTARLVERVRTLRLGHGLDEGVTLGPLISEAGVRKVSDFTSMQVTLQAYK